MLAFILAYILFVGEFFYREGYLRKDGIPKKIKAGKYDKGSTLFAGGSIVFGFFLPLFFLIFHVGYPIHMEFFPWIGELLMIFGAIIQVIAIKTLGKFYSRTLVVQERQIVVRKGIYKLIRHPGYLGGLFVWFGFGLGTGNWVSFVIIAAIEVCYFLYRIHCEELMLEDTLGTLYVEYKRHTYRLIPYLF